MCYVLCKTSVTTKSKKKNLINRIFHGLSIIWKSFNIITPAILEFPACKHHTWKAIQKSTLPPKIKWWKSITLWNTRVTRRTEGMQAFSENMTTWKLQSVPGISHNPLCFPPNISSKLQHHRVTTFWCCFHCSLPCQNQYWHKNFASTFDLH